MAWQIEREGDVAVVTMNTNKSNNQNEEFFKDLDHTFDLLEKDFSDSSVVLTGQGKIFSAGLDFQESFSVFGSRDIEKIQSWYYRYRNTNLKIFTYPRPTVAAINGHAIAGGLVTALNCDLRVASEGKNKYYLNEVPIGIPMPGCYLEIVRYATNNSTASRISLFGEEIQNEKAKSLGLIHEIVDGDRLIEEAVRMASLVPKSSFTSFEFSKKALQQPFLDRIERLDELFDKNIGKAMSSEGSIISLGIKFEEIMGQRAPWDIRD